MARINNKADISNVFTKCADYENYIKNELEYILTTSDDSDDNSGYKNMMFRKYILKLRDIYNIEMVRQNFSNNYTNGNRINELKMKISAAEQMVVLIDMFKPIFDNASSHIDDANQPYNRIGITGSMFAGACIMPSTYDDDIKFTIREGKVIGQWVNQSILCNFNNQTINKFTEAFINAPEEFEFRSEDDCMEITINKKRQNFQNGYVIFQRNLTIQNGKFIVFNDVWKFYFTALITFD